ncbi:MAG TPA: hypothetical protein VG889_18305 [Rhizomicrobium sp.]|nr:hypothetical protein [Rhizomicrobium sp.]
MSNRAVAGIAVAVMPLWIAGAALFPAVLVEALWRRRRHDFATPPW